MTDPLGSYTFLPWLRQGISTQMGETDGTPIQGHADVKVTVALAGGPESVPIDVTVNLLGPGDIQSFDVRTITRHWPRPDVFEVEPNYFPLLELFPADIAWRYTPAKADVSKRLRPWLGLVVLRDDEIDSVSTASAQLPNPKLTTKAGAPLPDPDQLWAWAHVHVDAASSVTVADLQTTLSTAAHQVVARLLCPRQLQQRTAYTAFLVPTLEAARLAALGLAVSPTLNISQAAWKADGSAVELPVFYSWRFETSDTGDFETLVKRIVPQPLPPTVGQRPMTVATPGMSLPEAASTSLAVESALLALESVPTPWDAGEKADWITALAALLNMPADRLEQAGAPRTLAPPLYGQWYAATSRLDPTSPPPWFQDLNADPRTRVAAALGWQAVQDEQQQLLAGAWAQVDTVRAANAELRFAQLAREAARRLYDRHVLVLPQASLATFTAPLHARFLIDGAAAPRTARALVMASPLRGGILEPALSRLARPLGPVGVRQQRATQPPASSMIERVNAGSLVLAPAPVTPDTLITPQTAGIDLAPSWMTPEVADWLKLVPNFLWGVLDKLLELLLGIWPAFAAPTLRAEVAAFLAELQAARAAGGSVSDDIDRRIAVRDGVLTAALVMGAPARPGFVARALQSDGSLPALAPSTAPEDQRFRAAVAQAFGDVNAPPASGITLVTVDLPSIVATAVKAIDPGITVAATIRKRLDLAGTWAATDTLDPVVAAPVFTQPMYEPLRDISTDWILAGLGDLPQDVVALARPNERFIESYMLGANNEMGRTLLFNEYPTDQRGSYFRQFFDVSGVTDPEPDIKPITSWLPTADLGDNAVRANVADSLVLIVRAELLRRYPNTVVYAVQAQWNADGSRSVPKPGAVVMQPDFQGSLGTGTAFWGFPLTKEAALGSDVPAQGTPGWYFALQEHSSEPRFGLEPPAAAFGTSPDSWQKLAWSDLVADAASLSQLNYIDLGATLPKTAGITGPARWHVDENARSSDLAYATYREPVRLLVHASKMIPGGK